jgi:rare lipoprotein A (peptidoglycan hydrolase)
MRRTTIIAGLIALALLLAGQAGAKDTGCQTHACKVRTCVTLACKHRVAYKLAARRPMAPATASWYGPGLYGNPLACGGRLTPGTFGVAHKALPCGTRVRLCAARCVTAPVVDRGPFVVGRTFDLTAPVRAAIGAAPVAQVRWRVVRG